MIKIIKYFFSSNQYFEPKWYTKYQLDKLCKKIRIKEEREKIHSICNEAKEQTGCMSMDKNAIAKLKTDKRTKIITVKYKDSVASYCSGVCYRDNSKGESERVELTEDEMEQHCYRQLIDHVREKQFNKIIISIISDYLGVNKEDLQNIEIKSTYKNFNSVRNIWKEFDE